MDEYDNKTQFLFELLETHFKITIQDLSKKGVLRFVVDPKNHEPLKLMIIKISRRVFNDSNHKKNYALKAIIKQSSYNY